MKKYKPILNMDVTDLTSNTRSFRTTPIEIWNKLNDFLLYRLDRSFKELLMSQLRNKL